MSLFGFRGCLFPPSIKKNGIPRFAPIDKHHLYDPEKTLCIFFMSVINTWENRAVQRAGRKAASPQESTNYLLENLTPFYNDITSD